MECIKILKGSHILDWKSARRAYKKTAWNQDVYGWKVSEDLVIIRHDCSYYAEHRSKGILHKSNTGINKSHEQFRAYKTKSYALQAAIDQLNPTEGIDVYKEITIFY